MEEERAIERVVISVLLKDYNSPKDELYKKTKNQFCGGYLVILFVENGVIMCGFLRCICGKITLRNY